MPITHLTSTPVFQSGTGNRTVTPNASTAVGDVMVLPVGFQDSSATTITTPSGFTVQKSAILTGTLKTSLFTRTRQSGDSTWTYAPNQSVETSHLVLSVNGGDPASLIVGADGTRAASGGTTATTAPSITTTVANTRVFIIATERTTANETVEATVNNGFTKILHTYANGTSAESIFLGFKDVATPGAVGATTVTFQNSQASNGYAVLFAVAPASTAQDIAGSVPVVTTASATFTTRQVIAGSASVVSTTTAAFTVIQHIAGVIPAQSTVDGAFTVVRGIAGSVDARSEVTGSVSSRQLVAGDATFTADVVGALTSRAMLSGTVTATTTTSASFTVASAPVPFAGSVAVAVAVTASLKVSRTISGAVDLTSSTNAIMTVSAMIVGVVTAETAVAGDFTVGGSVPLPPVPKIRTLTGTWSTELTEATIIRTLAGTRVQHTLEEA